MHMKAGMAARVPNLAYTPGELAAFIREDTKRWEPVVKATGVKLD